MASEDETNWRVAYLVVLGSLLGVVVILALVTRAYP